MRRVAGFLILLAAAAFATTAAGETPDIGARIYNGVGKTGAVASVGGTAPVSATRFPCRSCHGRDGTGGREGGAPPVRLIDLFRTTPARPAYDRTSLRAALEQGRASDGRMLANVMPRYRLDEPAFAGLSRYLGRIVDIQKAGIRPREVVFGVAVPSDNPATAIRYGEALRRALREASGGRTVNGRDVSVELLEGTPDAILSKAGEVAAVVGLAPSAVIGVAAFTDRQVPVLFPLYPLSGAEDATIVRGIMADRQATLRAIADRVATDKVDVLGVLDDPGCGGLADVFIRRFGRSGVQYERIPSALPVKTPSAVLLLCEDRRRARKILESLPRDTRLYGIASELLLSVEEARRAAVLAIPEATLTARAENRSMIDAHAAASARLLIAALTLAGRDVNRTRLVASVGALRDAALGVDFSGGVLNGTSAVTFIESNPESTR